MTIPRGYVPNHKFWDRMGRITPNVEWSESHRPNLGQCTVAGWLPTLRYEQEYEEYLVVSSGKVVALDREGHACPAGLRKAWNVAGATTILTYTATDAAEYVVDLTTGVTVTGATSYTETQVTTALRERGLIRHDERAMDFISKPIGMASYNYYKSPGTDHFNPATLHKHNVRPQALVAVTCDYVSTYPVLPAVATAEVMANDRMANPDGAMEDVFDGTTARTASWYRSAQVARVTRYASEVSAGDDVVAYTMVNYPVAVDTAQSTIAASVAGLVREVSSISDISAAGDYFVDYELGVLFLYEAGGNAIPTPWATTSTITYYHYAAEGTATNTVSTYACATGNLEFGDFLTYDANSNLIKAALDIGTAEGFDGTGDVYTTDQDYDTAADTAISLQIEQAVEGWLTGIVAQVIGVNNFDDGEFDQGYLSRVATEYLGQSSVTLQTPGMATGGRTDQLTYANAAERMIIVNLIFR